VGPASVNSPEPHRAGDSPRGCADNARLDCGALLIHLQTPGSRCSVHLRKSSTLPLDFRQYTDAGTNTFVSWVQSSMPMDTYRHAGDVGVASSSDDMLDVGRAAGDVRDIAFQLAPPQELAPSAPTEVEIGLTATPRNSNKKSVKALFRCEYSWPLFAPIRCERPACRDTTEVRRVSKAQCPSRKKCPRGYSSCDRIGKAN
jgi:hypothetical protein